MVFFLPLVLHHQIIIKSSFSDLFVDHHLGRQPLLKALVVFIYTLEPS